MTTDTIPDIAPETRRRIDEMKDLLRQAYAEIAKAEALLAEAERIRGRSLGIAS